MLHVASDRNMILWRHNSVLYHVTLVWIFVIFFTQKKGFFLFSSSSLQVSLFCSPFHFHVNSSFGIIRQVLALNFFFYVFSPFHFVPFFLHSYYYLWLFFFFRFLFSFSVPVLPTAVVKINKKSTKNKNKQDVPSDYSFIQLGCNCWLKWMGNDVDTVKSSIKFIQSPPSLFEWFQLGGLNWNRIKKKSWSWLSSFPKRGILGCSWDSVNMWRLG